MEISREKCSCKPPAANFPATGRMNSSFLMVNLSKPVDSAQFIEKLVLFPLCHLGHTLSDHVCGSDFEICSIPLVPLSTLDPIPQYPNYCSFIISFDVWAFVFFKIVLAVLGPLHVYFSPKFSLSIIAHTKCPLSF